MTEAPPPLAWLRRSATAALVVICVLLPALQGSPVEARPLVTGITNVNEKSPLALQQARATGAQFVRIPLFWKGTAPQERPAAWNPENPGDPAYAWGPSDEDVRVTVESGLTPVLQIENAPLWAQRCKTPDGLDPPAICDPNPADLAAFARAAAVHYSGNVPGVPRVTHWQALNEPNLSIFFFPQYDTSGRPLSPALYRELVNAFYGAIKAVDRSNLVLMAGLGPIAVPPWTMGPMRFTRELLCMKGHRQPRPTRGDCGGGVHFDIFAMHPYTTGGPTHQGGINDVQLGDIPKLKRLLRAADRAGRIKGQYRHTPLWVTEFSWDSRPPDPGGLPMRILTRWTAEALHQAWRSGVSHFFWYSLRDSIPDPDRPFSSTLEAGLYFRGATIAQDQPKPSMYAFRFPFVAYPGKGRLSIWGRTPTGTKGRVAIQCWRKGRWRRIAVRWANGQGIFRSRLQSGYGRSRRGKVRAVYAGQGSPAFSMRPVKDFRHPPFG